MNEGSSSKAVRSFPLAPFIPALLRILLWCRAEKLRLFTAATVISISSLKDISFILDWISKCDLKNVRANHIHAVLSLMSFVLKINNYGEVKERVRKILMDLIRTGLWLKWCDLNKYVFLLMCNDLHLEFTTSIDTNDLVLTKRPLAEAVLLGGNFDYVNLGSDYELRLEIYRYIQKSAENVKNVKFILDYVIDDLKNCVTERDASRILDVIYLNKESFSDTDRKAIAEYVLLRLGNWKMPNTISLARRLLAFLFNKVTASTEELKWIEQCTYVEEKLSKEIALQVGAHYLKQGFDKRVLTHMIVFLQDDDLHIRELASTILSPFLLKTDRVLNPAVCYRLMRETVLPSEDEMTKKEVRHTEMPFNWVIRRSSKETLYDACSSNPYAETGYFGDYNEVKVMINDLLQSDNREQANT
ncbi:hypothetical protein DICVIV_11599 [Dictyocaulus viviparus]|uniref:Uncharacterized protein n=1 Tax=Dictyocaulus viviparus TaxID=29172 RepID=A0A0D8XFE5_DICVI|nr:hypothetical protein DICVIV_11599 [Dictyocaulus viviparus]